ncbi:hypothetical protein [Maritalea porphyrae]|uniref:hypothetical protein n=1 Tax=Maritalea porphyrae TaxID=880732 RepID=UPI0022B016F7|nr:hypothetical protein [Maritalea porphyrae]MCZ4270751.1 hypothetical protein [Maritalea porphyrae]
MANLMDKVRELDKLRQNIKQWNDQYKFSTSSAGPALREKISELNSQERKLLEEIDGLVSTPTAQAKTEGQQPPA